MNYYFASSSSSHKAEEYKKLLQTDNLFLPSIFDAEETGSTFKENAIIKLEHLLSLYKNSKDITDDDVFFADDSGLVINSCKDILGLYTSRFMGDAKQQDKNLEVVRIMKDIKDKSAYFICCIAFTKGLKGKIYTTEGRVCGFISDKTEGVYGFGYDPIFIPEGENKSVAQLGDVFKNKHSHRAKAAKSMIDMLNFFYSN